jgi:hypothetical protein
MNYTLAELKRLAKQNILEANMVYRFGDSIPERLKGFRKIIDANSVGIMFLNNDGKKSTLDILGASLIDWDDNSLSIFNPGERELTQDELDIMNQWKAIESTKEHQQQAQNDMLTDGSLTFWQKRIFFTNKGYEYLHVGNNKKAYNHNTNKVKDSTVKGDLIIKYELRKVINHG